jgi:putative hemolysin
MAAECNVDAMFDLIDPGPSHFLSPKARSRLNALLMKLTGLEGLRVLYRQIRSTETDTRFTDKILTCLMVKLEVNGGGLGRIPKTGPLVVVANHPYGGVEAAALPSLLLSSRHDVKILANHLLARVPELASLILPVDPFHGRHSAQSNLASVRRAVQWVCSGSALAIFPAGEVAHFQLSKGQVTDPVWQTSIGQLIRSLKAPVLPIFFPGCNSFIFQLAGLLHPKMRTALLVHEFLKKRGAVVSVRIGRPIPFDRLKEMPSSGELMEYLRQRTYLLAAQKDQPEPSSPGISLPLISPQTPTEFLQKEVDGLPTGQKLTRSGELEVLFARYDQIPCLMQEIGRLREVTFRAAGEGSGKSLDLDEFDRTYLQLFIWNRRRGELVGAYRLGLTDLILNRQGQEGFYTGRLFEYRESFLASISPGIELGRSFVRPDYQRSYLPLLLLWRGIGKFLTLKPWYRYLFGAVSMSSSYHNFSRRLLVSHLSRDYNSTDLAHMVRPRNPVRKDRLADHAVGRLSMKIKGLDDLSDIISDLEQDDKGLPVLFRKYLELGGRLLAFNLDPQFNNTLDGLIFVDLPQANRRLLEFYMGRDCAARYLRYHLEMDRIRRNPTGLEDGTRKGGAPEKGAKKWRPAVSTS